MSFVNTIFNFLSPKGRGESEKNITADDDEEGDENQIQIDVTNSGDVVGDGLDSTLNDDDVVENGDDDELLYKNQRLSEMRMVDMRKILKDFGIPTGRNAKKQDLFEILRENILNGTVDPLAIPPDPAPKSASRPTRSGSRVASRTATPVAPSTSSSNLSTPKSSRNSSQETRIITRSFRVTSSNYALRKLTHSPEYHSPTYTYSATKRKSTRKSVAAPSSKKAKRSKSSGPPTDDDRDDEVVQPGDGEENGPADRVDDAASIEVVQNEAGEAGDAGAGGISGREATANGGEFANVVDDRNENEDDEHEHDQSSADSSAMTVQGEYGGGAAAESSYTLGNDGDDGEGTLSDGADGADGSTNFANIYVSHHSGPQQRDEVNGGDSGWDSEVEIPSNPVVGHGAAGPGPTDEDAVALEEPLVYVGADVENDGDLGSRDAHEDEGEVEVEGDEGSGSMSMQVTEVTVRSRLSSDDAPNDGDDESNGDGDDDDDDDDDGEDGRDREDNQEEGGQGGESEEYYGDPSDAEASEMEESEEEQEQRNAAHPEVINLASSDEEEVDTQQQQQEEEEEEEGEEVRHDEGAASTGTNSGRMFEPTPSRGDGIGEELNGVDGSEAEEGHADDGNAMAVAGTSQAGDGALQVLPAPFAMHDILSPAATPMSAPAPVLATSSIDPLVEVTRTAIATLGDRFMAVLRGEGTQRDFEALQVLLRGAEADAKFKSTATEHPADGGGVKALHAARTASKNGGLAAVTAAELAPSVPELALTTTTTDNDFTAQRSEHSTLSLVPPRQFPTSSFTPFGSSDGDKGGAFTSSGNNGDLAGVDENLNVNHNALVAAAAANKGDILRPTAQDVLKLHPSSFASTPGFGSMSFLKSPSAAKIIDYGKYQAPSAEMLLTESLYTGATASSDKEASGSGSAADSSGFAPLGGNTLGNTTRKRRAIESEEENLYSGGASKRLSLGDRGEGSSFPSSFPLGLAKGGISSLLTPGPMFGSSQSVGSGLGASSSRAGNVSDTTSVRGSVAHGRGRPAFKENVARVRLPDVLTQPTIARGHSRRLSLTFTQRKQADSRRLSLVSKPTTGSFGRLSGVGFPPHSNDSISSGTFEGSAMRSRPASAVVARRILQALSNISAPPAPAPVPVPVPVPSSTVYAPQPPQDHDVQRLGRARDQDRTIEGEREGGEGGDAWSAHTRHQQSGPSSSSSSPFPFLHTQSDEGNDLSVSLPSHGSFNTRTSRASKTAEARTSGSGFGSGRSQDSASSSLNFSRDRDRPLPTQGPASVSFYTSEDTSSAARGGWNAEKTADGDEDNEFAFGAATSVNLQDDDDEGPGGSRHSRLPARGPSRPSPSDGLDDYDDDVDDEGNPRIQFTFSPPARRSLGGDARSSANQRRGTPHPKKRDKSNSPRSGMDSAGAASPPSSFTSASGSATSTGKGSLAATGAPAANSAWAQAMSTNKVKCPVCLVPNAKGAAKCVSCESNMAPSAPTPAPALAPTAGSGGGGGSGSGGGIWAKAKAGSADEVKCSSCWVVNKRDAVKCVSCESDIAPSTSGSAVAPPVTKKTEWGPSPGSSAVVPSGWGANLTSAPAPAPAPASVPSTGGFGWGAPAPTFGTQAPTPAPATAPAAAPFASTVTFGAPQSTSPSKPFSSTVATPFSLTPAPAPAPAITFGFNPSSAQQQPQQSISSFSFGAGPQPSGSDGRDDDGPRRKRGGREDEGDNTEGGANTRTSSASGAATTTTNYNFGSAPTPSATSSFGFSFQSAPAPAPAAAVPPALGASSATTPSAISFAPSFAAAPATAPAPAAALPTFSLAPNGAAPAPAFSFGTATTFSLGSAAAAVPVPTATPTSQSTPTAASTSVPTPFMFGASAAASTTAPAPAPAPANAPFMFGANTSAPVSSTSNTAPAPFMFGSTSNTALAPAPAPAPAPASLPFNPAGLPPTPSGAGTPSFLFPGTSTVPPLSMPGSGSGSNPTPFMLGGPAPTTSTQPFIFGAQAPAPAPAAGSGADSPVVGRSSAAGSVGNSPGSGMDMGYGSDSNMTALELPPPQQFAPAFSGFGGGGIMGSGAPLPTNQNMPGIAFPSTPSPAASTGATMGMFGSTPFSGGQSGMFGTQSALPLPLPSPSPSFAPSPFLGTSGNPSAGPNSSGFGGGGGGSGGFAFAPSVATPTASGPSSTPFMFGAGASSTAVPGGLGGGGGAPPMMFQGSRPGGAAAPQAASSGFGGGSNAPASSSNSFSLGSSSNTTGSNATAGRKIVKAKHRIGNSSTQGR